MLGCLSVGISDAELQELLGLCRWETHDINRHEHAQLLAMDYNDAVYDDDVHC